MASQGFYSSSKLDLQLENTAADCLLASLLNPTHFKRRAASQTLTRVHGFVQPPPTTLKQTTTKCIVYGYVTDMEIHWAMHLVNSSALQLLGSASPCSRTYIDSRGLAVNSWSLQKIPSGSNARDCMRFAGWPFLRPGKEMGVGACADSEPKVSQSRRTPVQFRNK